MITCETPGMMWTVEGRIEESHNNWQGPHEGIGELSHLLAQHVGRWAKVRVELIEGPRPLPYRSRSGKLIEDEPSPRAIEATGGASKVGEELKRMRSLATEVRERMATILRAAWVTTVEEQCIETLAETMLAVCDQLEEFDRRLKRLEDAK